MEWQVAEAKQRFSEVLRAVRTGEPQTITHHGREVAVVVDIEKWRRLTVAPVDLTAVLTGPPHLDAAADALEAVAANVARPTTVTRTCSVDLPPPDERVVRDPAGPTARGVTAWLQDTPSRSLFVCILTLGEIEKGITLLAERGDRRQADALSGWLEQLVAGLEDRLLPVTACIARTWGQLPRRAAAPAVDGLLAATALVLGHTMVTRNTRDMVSMGVPLLDPFEG